MGSELSYKRSPSFSKLEESDFFLNFMVQLCRVWDLNLLKWKVLLSFAERGKGLAELREEAVEILFTV